MRGITEDRLKEVFSKLYWSRNDEKELFNALLSECTELNAWRPIETAPLNTPIRLFKKAGYQYEGAIMIESHRDFFTHWQELPEDPK